MRAEFERTNMKVFLFAAAVSLALAAPALADAPSAPAIMSIAPAADAVVPAGDVTLTITLAEEGKITDLTYTKPDGERVTLVDWGGEAAKGTVFSYELKALTAGTYGVNYTVGHLTSPASISSAIMFTVE